MSANERKGFLRAFWDFLVLFIGISTTSNLSRTRRKPVERRGFFLFRKTRKTDVDISGEDNANDDRDSGKARH